MDALKTDEDPKEIDFFTKQARLQIEARMALAQAKDIAHMQMEVSEENLNAFFSHNLFNYKSTICLPLFLLLDGTSKANGVTNHKHDS